MGCTEEAMENKKPMLPAEWESFKNIRERGPISNWKHALIHIQHPGLFWLIIRLLLGFQPPQTKTQHGGRTSGRRGGGCLRWAAIYWMLFVLNWCNCSRLQLQHFPRYPERYLRRPSYSRRILAVQTSASLHILDFSIGSSLISDILMSHPYAVMQLQCSKYRQTNKQTIISWTLCFYTCAPVLPMRAHLGFLLD